MFDLAPGNILQRLHFRRRLQVFEKRFEGPADFIEIGAGTGWLSADPLARGWRGTAFDLNSEACAANARRNAAAVAEGRYRIVHGSFDGDAQLAGTPAALVFSCMVLEHLSDEEIRRLIGTVRAVSRPDAIFAAFVPAGMRYWGVEDEVAGHLRRYERSDLAVLSQRENLRLLYSTGLTFPVSNLLLPLSNRLVARSEDERRRDSLTERTVASGCREVWLKTRFPRWLGWMLNDRALYPLDLLQRLFARSRRSMVLYSEWELTS